MRDQSSRVLAIDSSFSLNQTAAPVAWGKGGWPNVDWIDETLVWVGWETGRLVWRRVSQSEVGSVSIEGIADPLLDAEWANAMLGAGRIAPAPEDPIVAVLAARYPGMRPYSAGNLFDGIVSSIVGQSISVRSAAVTEGRLAQLFHPGIELAGRLFTPMPTMDQIASAEVATVRTSGVTWRRAEALVAVAQAGVEGRLPSDAEARADSEAAKTRIRGLPLVGPWTAESAMLWGLGADDAYPSGDVALLRAARLVYCRDDLVMKEMDALAVGWAPHRSWASRWLWMELLGVAGANPPTS